MLVHGCIAPKLPRRCPGPLPESAMEGAALRESQFQRDVHDASFRVTQITDGKVAPKLILDALVGRPLLMQPAPHGGGSHVEFAGEAIEVRDLARQQLAQAAADSRAQA